MCSGAGITGSTVNEAIDLAKGSSNRVVDEEIVFDDVMEVGVGLWGAGVWERGE